MSTENQGPAPSAPKPHPPRRSSTGLKGLAAQVFDLSFETMVTPKLIQILFVILCFLQVIPVFALLVSAFSASMTIGILSIFLAPVLYVVSVLFVRIYLELVIVIFRIYETLRERPL